MSATSGYRLLTISVRIRRKLHGVLRGNRTQTPCLVTATDYEVPPGSPPYVEYAIEAVAADLPDDVYTLIVDEEELRVILRAGEWHVIGRV
jgi:hypothetical protein